MTAARWKVFMTDDRVPPRVKTIDVVAVTDTAAKMRADRHEQELGSPFRSAGASRVEVQP